MPAQISMPQQSDTMTEGTVVKWLAKEGDRVKAGQIIAEIETDKATMEMESFDSGTVAALLVKEGEKVPVGTLIAVLAAGNENPADIKQKYASGAAAAPAQAPAAKSAAAGKPERIPPQASRSSSTATLEAASAGEIHEPANVG